MFRRRQMLHYYTFCRLEPVRLKIRYRRGLGIVLWAATLLAALPLQAGESSLRIVATIKPLQLLVQAVVGDEQPVDVLLDPRMSPHDYQLRPSDRTRLDRADIVFWIGPDMEVFMAPVLASLGINTRIVALQREIGASGDPHLWMDPLLAAAMGHRIADTLAKLAPAHSDRWRANAANLERLLVDEDGQLRARLAAIGQPRGYLVAHDAYSRFEDRYGVRHREALTDHADLPPSAQHIARIEAALNAGEIGCVLREPGNPPKILQNLLKNRQLYVASIDAMGREIAVGERGIVDFYRQLGASMEKCLRP